MSINLHIDLTVDVQAKIGFREQKVGLICINVRVTDNIKCLTQCCVLLKITVYKKYVWCADAPLSGCNKKMINNALPLSQIKFANSRQDLI